jgi:endonuclease/exonuclease/phosphatase family metal-dependent hydrolase
MRQRHWFIAIIAAGMVAAGAYQASLPVATGPADGSVLEGECPQPAPGGDTLCIGSFNIHGGKGRDGRRDLQRVAECLRGLDFVALNEVHGGGLWQSENQAWQLGRRLDMAWLFAPTARTWYCFEAGNALLSTLPVGVWQRIPLVRRYDRSYRNAVQVDLHFQGRTIHVLATHINRRHDAERQAQLGAVIALYLAMDEPAILLGDLNSDRRDPQIRQLLATPGVKEPVGQMFTSKSAGGDSADRIDWIFTRGLRPIDAGVRDDGASDHPLVWARLQLLPDPQEMAGE